MLAILFIQCDKDEDPQEVFTGSLTILQKDAYGNLPGRSSDLWPPHTTTVFKWSNVNGTIGDSVFQENHGTLPGQTNSLGQVLLEPVKILTFTATRDQMVELQNAYMNAVCDDNESRFLTLEHVDSSIAQLFHEDLGDVLGQDGSFSCTDLPIDSLLSWLNQGTTGFGKIATSINACNYTMEDWRFAFEQSLKNTVFDLDHLYDNYHVCNNDAYKQVRLIENFIETGIIEIPEGDCNGPMWYYSPD